MATVISVEHLSKAYRLGQIGTGTLSRDINVWWAKLRGKPNPMLKIGDTDHGNRDGETIWALKDVNFTVEQGEALGIIGRNGAGKSTLLKILSRVTAPTSGHARVKGRIASLLEVGTGFHPDLTGRENIYLNGAILGMIRQEVRRKFNEIVDFSGVEKFIDTPVKRYSSGMFVRLAFAVAAHLEPEILMVDEVLAVGDAEFQKRCLGKMGDVAKEGRTVLFVSHNMQAISTLCPTTILLNNGKIVMKGITSQLIAQYLSSKNKQSAEVVWAFDTAPGTSIVRLHAVRLMNEKYEVRYDFEMDKPIILEAEFWIMRKARMTPSFWLYNQQGINLFATANFHDPVWGKMVYEPGLYSCWCTIPDHYLNEGQHYVTVVLSRETSLNLVEIREVVSFNVYECGDTRADYIGPWIGVIRPLLLWDGKRIGDVSSTAIHHETSR